MLSEVCLRSRGWLHSHGHFRLQGTQPRVVEYEQEPPQVPQPQQVPAPTKSTLAGPGSPEKEAHTLYLVTENELVVHELLLQGEWAHADGTLWWRIAHGFYFLSVQLL